MKDHDLGSLVLLRLDDEETQTRVETSNTEMLSQLFDTAPQLADN